MKKTSFLLGLLLSFSGVFAQETHRNTTISVVGTAQKVITPKFCKVTFLLQEEMKSEDQRGTSKISIDTIKQLFFDNVKAYGLKESDFIVIKKSSQPYGGRTSSSNLYNIIYQLKNVKFVLADKLVSDLRFTGLRGIIAKPQYTDITRPELDSLNAAAIDDAHSIAVKMATKVNKSIGEVTNLSFYDSVRNFGIEYDPEDLYSLSKFEIALIDSKNYPVTATITYELKN